MLDVIEDFAGRVRSLAAGEEPGEERPEVTLPEELEDLVEALRVRLRELRLRCRPSEGPSREVKPIPDDQALNQALAANSAALLTGLARQGLSLVDRLAATQATGEDEELGKSFARLEAIAQGFLEQSRLMTRLQEERERDEADRALADDGAARPAASSD